MRLAIDNAENQGQIAKKLVGLLGSKNEEAQGRAAHVLWQVSLQSPTPSRSFRDLL